jgi:hypothetical protein
MHRFNSIVFQNFETPISFSENSLIAYKFEPHKALIIKLMICWVMTPYSLVR